MEVLLQVFMINLNFKVCYSFNKWDLNIFQAQFWNFVLKHL